VDYSKHFDFVKNRNKFFYSSLIVLLIGFIVLVAMNLNYGVDFKAGTSLDINIGKSVTKEQVDQAFGSAGVKPAVLTIGGNSDHVSARFETVLSEDELKLVNAKMVEAFGDKVSQEVNTVSADIAKELGIKAIVAVAVASIAICIYVTIRFEWRFAIASILAVLHDALMVIAIFAIFRLEVSLPFLAAVLTTIGYSINDKIVVFDRIRENLRFSRMKTSEDVAKLVNDSIWQTMSRNLNTVIVVLIAAICLFIFGSESIKLFALAKIVGLASGAYSSIFLAAPLWYLLKRKTVGSKVKATAVKE